MPLEHPEVGCDVFGGVHLDLTGIAVTPAIPTPASKLEVFEGWNGGECDQGSSSDIGTACRAAGNPTDIADNLPSRFVGIDDVQRLSSGHTDSLGCWCSNVVIVVASLVGVDFTCTHIFSCDSRCGGGTVDNTVAN